MKKMRFMSLVLCLAMIISSISLTAMALTFDDVENDSTVAWAKDSINKMTDAGYIKGYEDGTFRPYKAITKIESLILMSRMLGFENDEFAGSVANAEEMYKSVATKYNSTYASELSYLLYCGILKESELVDYASSANANTQLLRYQAAMLMAKLLGADADAKAYTVATPTYSDNIAIPQAARPYVEYVTAEGIMNGMDETEGGQPQFSPVTTLTRAQMATLLARMMDKLDLARVSGTVDGITNAHITVGGERVYLTNATSVYSDGAKVSASDISEGDLSDVIRICGNALVIENEQTGEIITVYGKVVRTSESPDGRKIEIADAEDSTNTAEYTLRDDCVITVGSSRGNLTDLVKGDFVRVDINGSKVSSVSTEEASLEVNGVLVSTSYDDEDHVYLNVSDKDGSNEQTYCTSIKGFTVERNGDRAEITDLSMGDTVTLKLSYGKVTKIKATGKTDTFSGILTEIIISSNPAVTISINGETATYKLRSDVKIKVAGTETDIYALRPNVTVTGTFDGNEIKNISAASVAVGNNGEMSGTVTGKNTSYKVITIRDEDGNTQSVYYNSSTTFLNSSGSNSSVKSIDVGSKISVTGADKNGVFEATIIIIK